MQMGRHIRPSEIRSLLLPLGILLLVRLPGNTVANPNVNTNLQKGKVWAVLPNSIPFQNPDKYSVHNVLNDLNIAPHRKRKGKSRRESTSIIRHFRRQYPPAPQTGTGELNPNSALFYQGNSHAQIPLDGGNLCPPQCVCKSLEVECKNQKLREIPRFIPIRTEKLSLVGNKIQTLGNTSFWGLKNLKFLFLSNNEIEKIEPFAFDGLAQLKRLRINKNRISVLPKNAFTGLSQLQRLDLRHNQLKCLGDDAFKGLPSLQYLYLSHNNLEWLSPRILADQVQLKYIDLRRNPIACDCYLRPFIENFITTNRIPALMRSGATCHGNGLEGQPLNPHLLHLIQCPGSREEYNHPPASCAPASSLGSCTTVCDCSTDRVADCHGRGLKTVPADLPPGIMEINLAQNQLESLSEATFKNYPDLRKIVLDNNQLVRIHPKAFSYLTQLSSLYMSSNKLKFLPPGLFHGLKELKILYLHRNKISCLQKGSFEGLESLQILHLSDNRIQTFPQGSFNDLQRLKYLYLVQNPLMCDCRLAWLPAFLNEKEAGGSQWARCAGPTQVQGQHVRDLVPNRMECDKNYDSLADDLQCEDWEQRCPEKCRCSELTVKPVISARSEFLLRQDELGVISDGSVVDCSNSGLSDLPQELPSNTKELNLFGNFIRKIEAVSPLNKLKRLQMLNLHSNRIESIEDEAFVYNKKLERLILSNNSLTKFSKRVLTGLNNLNVLLLQHNQITCLNNKTFGSTPSLKILMLNNNKIRCITKGTFDNMELESLSLSTNPLKCNCHLSWLPDWLRDHAKQILAGPLPPTCVEPEELAGTSVASLSRYHFTCANPEQSCKDAIQSQNTHSTHRGSTEKRREPDCSREEYSCCYETADFVNQTTSTSCPANCACESDGVYCSDLNLTQIPPGIPAETTQLYLERNHITTIHSARLAHLTQLHTLVLSYNKLRELHENAFNTLENLKTLVLSHNNIQCIHPKAFNGLRGLRVLCITLAIACNYLHSKAGYFILQGNNVSSIPYGTFNGLSHLNNLALGQNPLHCDCNGKWLNSFFRQQFLDNGVALCHSPKNMQFKSLYHSKPSDFVCPWKRRRKRRNSLTYTSGPSGIEKNQTAHSEDLSNTLFLDDHRQNDVYLMGEADNFSYEDEEWVVPSMQDLKNGNNMSPEEKESLAIAAKCLPCMFNPCENDGRCIPRGQLDYECECKSPYHGRRCELQEHACSVNPCQNGGICESASYPAGYKCICPPEFRGPTCSQVIKHCKQNRCENGGTCEDVVTDFRCHCPPGYHGKTCQRALAYCVDFNPCMNGGKCFSTPGNKYKCECPSGWSGKNCQINDDDCFYNRCENGATCVDGISEYICKCRPGYAGIYCERPTWSLPNDVLRMDKRLPLMHGIGSMEVRHSPIKTRSLVTPTLETQCAYHQCQNRATCVESPGDIYRCLCKTGFSGQYCENLFSISLPSPHSYIAIVPPSRGALVPKGSISLNVATHVPSGIILYYAEMVQTGGNEAPEQYLLVDLHHGQVRTMFSLNNSKIVERRAKEIVNDGFVHKIKLVVQGDNITLTVDDLLQSQEGRDVKTPAKLTDADTSVLLRQRYLALTNPLYFGGAPVDRLETASRILGEKQILGMTGCIQDIQINERSVDLSSLFGAPVDKMTGTESEHRSEKPSPEAKHHGTAIGILPGCHTKPRSALLAELYTQQYVYNRSSGKTNAFSKSGVYDGGSTVPLSSTANDPCADPNACMNGGRCVTLSVEESNYKCECPEGYIGKKCEQVHSCQRTTQRSLIRDPQTGCVSTKILPVRTCSGVCNIKQMSFTAEISPLVTVTLPTSTSQIWFPSTHEENGKPENPTMLFKRETGGNWNAPVHQPTKTCCQPTKVKHRRVRFRCTNGSAYERTVKLVRKCSCQTCPGI